MTDVDIDELFREVDSDKDGRITLGLYGMLLYFFNTPELYGGLFTGLL